MENTEITNITDLTAESQQSVDKELIYRLGELVLYAQSVKRAGMKPPTKVIFDIPHYKHYGFMVDIPGLLDLLANDDGQLSDCITLLGEDFMIKAEAIDNPTRTVPLLYY